MHLFDRSWFRKFRTPNCVPWLSCWPTCTSLGAQSQTNKQDGQLRVISEPLWSIFWILACRLDKDGNSVRKIISTFILIKWSCFEVLIEKQVWISVNLIPVSNSLKIKLYLHLFQPINSFWKQKLPQILECQLFKVSSLQEQITTFYRDRNRRCSEMPLTGNRSHCQTRRRGLVDSLPSTR